MIDDGKLEDSPIAAGFFEACDDRFDRLHLLLKSREWFSLLDDLRQHKQASADTILNEVIMPRASRSLEQFNKSQEEGIADDFERLDLLVFVCELADAFSSVFGPDSLPSDFKERVTKAARVRKRLEAKYADVLEIARRALRAANDETYKTEWLNEVRAKASEESWQQFKKNTDLGEFICGLVGLTIMVAGVICLFYSWRLGLLLIILALAVIAAPRLRSGVWIGTFWN